MVAVGRRGREELEANFKGDLINKMWREGKRWQSVKQQKKNN